MQVDVAIILSAGKGTRMGELGRILAKPVWPFYGKTLLQLQVDFLRYKFGIKKFFINCHHLHEQIEKYKDSYIEIVYEPTLLDQGGGILNILKQYGLWNQNILISNADQLYFFSDELYLKGKENLRDSDVVLFSLNVEKIEGYNKLKISKGILTGIEKNSDVEDTNFLTFSGLSLINLKQEAYCGEVLPYFNSVADFKKKKVRVVEIEDGNYYDFGKLKDYYELVFEVRNQVLNEVKTPLIDLLSETVESYVKDDSGINFSDNFENVAEGEILLNEGKLMSVNSEIVSIKK